MNALNTNRINVNSPYKVWAEGLVSVSLSQEEKMPLQVCLTRASSVSDGDGFHT